ncbi:hypothetical protein EFB08_03455 [Rufibacter latericius]|uniref:Uncharacterized protein n=1 Tax=Rufibacter latericius TaxID=2487040 RepID=A0A3M9N1J0_9BACT|nr:hypothetical protein EFB08_03455 [Rufibacter latericius]
MGFILNCLFQGNIKATRSLDLIRIYFLARQALRWEQWFIVPYQPVAAGLTYVYLPLNYKPVAVLYSAPCGRKGKTLFTILGLSIIRLHE